MHTVFTQVEKTSIITSEPQKHLLVVDGWSGVTARRPFITPIKPVFSFMSSCPNNSKIIKSYN